MVCSANDAGKPWQTAVKNEERNFAELMNQKPSYWDYLKRTFRILRLWFEKIFLAFWPKSLVKPQSSLRFSKIWEKPSGFLLAQKPAAILPAKPATNSWENIEVENIKTGYTVIAKGSIIARVKRGGKSLIIFVIGRRQGKRFIAIVWRGI